MNSNRTRLTLVVRLLSAAAVGLVAVPAGADVATDWNQRTVAFVNAAGRPGPSGIIDSAMVHIAMHDAVQAYQQRFETYNEPIPGASGSVIAAVATAARDVLVSRFPAQAPQVDAAYQAYMAAASLLPTDAGVAVGQMAAARMIQRRLDDGAFPPVVEIVTGGTALGQWRPTPPGFMPMVAPWLGDVTPFALKDREGLLREPGPPHLSSGLYARDYNEVKVMGARVGSGRTGDQTDLAFFYSGNFLTQMNGIARSVAIARLSDIGDTARLLALANLSAADALILAWNAKRTYMFWRPSTAIHEGDFDDNANTVGDPAWLPLINDPAYPDYTSGANSFTNAFIRTLQNYLGNDNWTFVVTTTAPAAVQRERVYHRFSAVADDVVDARVYLGIHFRFADTVARRQAKQAADRAFGHLLRPLE